LFIAKRPHMWSPYLVGRNSCAGVAATTTLHPCRSSPDGKKAVCHGTAQEYKKILGWSMKDDKKAIRKEAKAAEKASKKAAR